MKDNLTTLKAKNNKFLRDYKKSCKLNNVPINKTLVEKIKAKSFKLEQEYLTNR